MCVLVLHPLLFPYRRVGKHALISTCETVQADLTDWVSFLSSSLTEEISSNTEALSTNTHLISMEKQKKQGFKYKCFNIANYKTNLHEIHSDLFLKRDRIKGIYSGSGTGIKFMKIKIT